MKSSSSLMSSSLWSIDQSLAGVGSLTDEQQLRLTDVLDRWLQGLEQGTPLAQEQLLAQHPDLAETLQRYFHSLADLHELAAGFGAAADHAHTESTDETEKRIGDFVLLRELGRGGMGVVYEARQLSLDRHVAIKILPFASVLDSRQIARFKNEAQAAAQLHHPHIVPVFAIGVDRGVHYYAMQLVNGQSLEQWLIAQREERATRRGRRLPPEHFANVARLGVEAAEALHAAHEYGIVHRDIKPSNLLIEPVSCREYPDGGASKLWVTDFGLARIQREAALTRTGDLVGTLRYMSPEQATGKSALVDHRTDIYSLGATLYELASLTPAYRDDHSATLLRQIEAHDPSPLRQLRPEIPADLAHIIHRAMSRQRDERYATAADFAADLRRFLAGEPTVARAPSLLEQVTRFGQRQARALAVATSLLLLLVIGLTIGTLLVVRAQRRAEASLAQAQQSARDAREVLDRFGRQLSERLAYVAGAEEVRRDLLLAASEYYRRFIAESQADPALQSELAVAYGRLASLLDEVGTAAESLAAHEQAVAYLQRSSQQRGADESRRQLAVAQNNLALALRRAGQFTAAQGQLQQAIGIQKPLHSAAPGNRAQAAELATSYNNLGLVLRDADNHAAAATAFQQAIDEWSRLLAAESGSPTYRQKLAVTYNNLAGTFLTTEPQRAVEWYEQALRMQVPAKNSEQQRELALTHQNLAAALSRSRQLMAAAAEYRQAIEIQTALVARLPAQQSIRRELAVSYNNLGLVLTRLQDSAAAIQAFSQAADWQQQLLGFDPNDPSLLSQQGSTLSNRGVALSQQGDQAGAVEKLTAAVTAQEQASELAPDSEPIRDLLARHRALLNTTKQKLETVAATSAP